MTRHPFDGPNRDSLTRRAALGVLATTISTTNILAQKMQVQPGIVATTRAAGEEGGQAPATTALGEAGGPGSNKPVTTEPFGEEAGRVFSIAVPGLEDGQKPGASPEPDKPRNPIQIEKVTTLALGEEAAGNPVAPAPTVVPVQPNTLEINETRCQNLWRELADRDVTKAIQASAILYGSKSIIPFLAKTLKPGMIENSGLDEATTVRLVTNLDHDDFKIREQAETDLSNAGINSIEIVEKNLETTRSAEMRMRLLRIRDAIKNPPRVNQVRRAIEILSALRTPEAIDLLKKLADGDSRDWVVRQAKRTLDQLGKPTSTESRPDLPDAKPQSPG